MSNRRERSKKISQPASAALAAHSMSGAENKQELDLTLKNSLNQNLKAKATGLKHHNWAYRITVGVFVWLMLLIYLPLTFF
jgi:hypothetical protein